VFSTVGHSAPRALSEAPYPEDRHSRGGASSIYGAITILAVGLVEFVAKTCP
jgi:hypothetical protein